MTVADDDLLKDSVLCSQTWPDHGDNDHSDRTHICARSRGDHPMHECGCGATVTGAYESQMLDDMLSILDKYEVNITNVGSGHRVVVLLCHREHVRPGVWVGIHAYDLAGDQSSMTLLDLAELAVDHEAEQHATLED